MLRIRAVLTNISRNKNYKNKIKDLIIIFLMSLHPWGSAVAAVGACLLPDMICPSAASPAGNHIHLA
jgi:hypothetical protein